MPFLAKSSVSFSCWTVDQLIGDGDTTLGEEGPSAFETLGRITHIRRRYPRRHPRLFHINSWKWRSGPKDIDFNSVGSIN